MAIHQKRFYMIFALVFAVTQAAADETSDAFTKAHRDFFHLLHPQKSELELAYTAQPKREEKGGPGEFDLNDVSFAVDLPYASSTDTFFSNGAIASVKMYDFKTVPSVTEVDSENLYKGVLQSGIGTFVTDDFLLQARTWFGFYDDLENGIDSDALRLFGEGETVYRLNPYTQVLAGIRASEDFDDTPVFPFVGVRLATTEGTLHFSITAPLEATVTYNLDETSLLYAGGWISGDEYRMTAGPLDREFAVHTYDQRVGAGVSYWFGKHFKLNLEAGALIGSELEFKTVTPGQFHGEMETGPYGTVRVGWGF